MKEKFDPIFQGDYFLKYKNTDINHFDLKFFKIGIKQIINPLKLFFEDLFINPENEKVILFLMNSFLLNVYPPNNFLFEFETKRLNLNMFGLLNKNPELVQDFMKIYNPNKFNTKTSFDVNIINQIDQNLKNEDNIGIHSMFYNTQSNLNNFRK